MKHHPEDLGVFVLSGEVYYLKKNWSYYLTTSFVEIGSNFDYFDFLCRILCHRHDFHGNIHGLHDCHGPHEAD